MLSKRLFGLHQRVRFSCGVYSQNNCKIILPIGANSTVTQPSPRKSIFLHIRHSSTNPVVPPVITKVLEAAIPVSDEAVPSSSIDSIVQSIGPIPEAPALPGPKILEILSNGEPSLTSLGLGGYSPIGLLQHLLEFIHLHTDLSWGWTIVIVAALIRMSCFKLTVRQRQESSKFASFMPQMQFLQQKLMEARQQNDYISATRYAMELSEFHKSNQVTMFGTIKYSLIQGAILLSFTAALRQMCNLPVESMQTSGFFLIDNLTMVDPTYLLPFINGFLMYLHFATGKELYQMMPTKGHLFVQSCMVGLGGLLFVFSVNFQGAILLYWITSQTVTVLQYHVLNHPKVKAYYNLDTKKLGHINDMMEREKAKKEKSSTHALGFISRIKEARSNARLAEEVKRRYEIDSAAFERAGREPIPKTYKYDITKVKKK